MTTRSQIWDGSQWVAMTAGAEPDHALLINVGASDHHARYTDAEAISSVDNGTYLKLTGGTITGLVIFNNILEIRDGSAGVKWSSNVEPGGRLRWFTGGVEYMSISSAKLDVLKRIDIQEFGGRPSLRMGQSAGEAVELYYHGVRRKLWSDTGNETHYTTDGGTAMYTVISGIGMNISAAGQDPGSSVARNITVATLSPSGGISGDVWLVYAP